MIAVMLILFFQQGEPHIHMLRAESIEACWAAMPAVSQRVPENASLTCIHVRTEDYI